MAVEVSRFEIATTSQAVDYTGDTLLLPCVSIGSIPQLAIDALLAPANATRLFGEKASLVGRLDHRYSVPFLGGASPSSSSNGASTLEGPLQLYRFSQAKVTVLQQRSPILKSRKHDFVEALMEWIQRKGFADVVVLTSLDAGLRTDAQMNSAFWYVDAATRGKPASRIQAKMQSTLPLYQQKSSSSNTSTSPSAPSSSSSSLPPMPSGGLARTYLEAAASTLDSTPMQAIVTFAAEGDNRHDALQMAALVATLLDLSHLPADSFSQPSDWDLLFGPMSGSDGMFT